MAGLAPSGGFGRRLRARLTGPTQAATLVVAPLFWLGARADLVADVPVWLLLGALAAAQLATAVAYSLWPGAQAGWRLTARIGVQLAAITFVVYAIGWGPTLAIGLLFGAADNLRVSGSRAGAPAIFWSVVGIAAGQLAIALDVAPSLVGEPLVHGLGALAALGVTLTILVLTWTTAEKESAQRELEQREQRFRALVQNASDIIMVIDREGRLAYVSPAFERTLGYEASGLLGTPALEFAHPDDADGARQALARQRANRSARAEVRLRHRSGDWLWFDARITNLFEDPDVEGVIANLRDVTEQTLARRELAEAEERFRSAFELAPIGMGMTGPDGRFLRVNRAFAEMLGYRPGELLDVHVSDVTHPEDRAATKRDIGRLLAGEIRGYQHEKRFLHADGHPLWASVSVSLVSSPDGRPVYMIGQVEDITERKAIAERLAHAAIHDALTGLPNRTLVVDRLGLALERAARHETSVGVIFLDLDRFKVVNDSLGHAAGDEVLRVLSKRLARAMRASDTVARFGGDEFVVLCDEVADEGSVVEVAERATAAIAAPLCVAGREVFLTASAGIVVSEDGTESPEDLLRDADAAMYRAKDEGRARIELFDERNRRHVVDQLETGTDLHHALERGEFGVYYQPLVDLETGRVSGFEALLRWRHPTRGLVLPEEFIELAEETGLIVPIGAWALEQACRQTAEWQHRRRPGDGPLAVGVNLSPRQLGVPSLVDDLAGILDSTGIERGSVWLELTESALMRDADDAARVLRALRAHGFRIAVDDFGTGYSSLAHLKRFPVDALKVDRSFVDGLGTEAEDTTIVNAVVGLAHSLGLAAIAEGLETEAQLAELRTMGCDYAQGFLFGAPRPAEALGAQPADDLSSWHEALAG